MQELVALGDDAFPLAHQILEVLGDGLLGSALSSGADDHAHVLRRDLRHDALQTAALTLAQLAAHARHTARRHQHKETTRQRDLRGQTGALVADRILGDLHQHRIARLERELDAARLAFQTCGIPVHLAGVQHAVAGLADVHERGLHARQHVLHAAEVDVADGGHLLDVRHVMLNEDVVLDHGDLGVAFTLAHHHQTLDMLAARQEILLHELVLAAALTAVVAAALLLGLQTGGALDVGDLVDVLLLAGATGQRLLGFLRLRTATAATATAGHRALVLLVVLATAAGLVFGVLLVVGLLTIAVSATTTTGARRLCVIVIIVAITGLVVDRRVLDAIEDQILLDLLHLGRGATLLRVQTTGTTRMAGTFLLTVGIVIVTATLAAIVAQGILTIRHVRIAAATTATARRTIAIAGFVGIVHITGTDVGIDVIGRITRRRSGRQNRLLEQ